jgi:hypothetical protein
MRKLVIVIVLLAVASYGLPLIIESADNPCNALERRFVNQAAPPNQPGVASLGRAFLGGLQGLTNGSFAIEYVRREHPNLPTGIACVEEYWRTFLPGNQPQQPH